MRWPIVTVLVVACGSAPPPRHEVSTAAVPEDAPSPDAVDDDDPDGDHIRGACDLCPYDAEVFNAILDEDGCPDSSATSHAVMHHPTNKYGHPLVKLALAPGARPLETWPLDDDIEVIACIGRAVPPETAATARWRAALLAKHVRSFARAGVQVVELSTTRAVYEDPDLGPDRGETGFVQVLRAQGIDVWRWETDHLVRATPRKRLEPAPRPAGCP